MDGVRGSWRRWLPALALVLMAVPRLAWANSDHGTPAAQATVPAQQQAVAPAGEKGHTENMPENMPAETHSDNANNLSWTTNRVLVVGGEALVEELLPYFVSVLWFLLAALHLARPYILGLMDKFSLRLGADLWWLAYVFLRDTVMLLTFVLSFFYYYPMLIAERPLPLFAPLSTTLLLAALVIKLTRDADEDTAAFVWVTRLIGLAGGLFLISTFYGVQSRLVPAAAPIARFLVSQTNQAWAYPILWVSLIGMAGLMGYVIYFAISSARPAREG